MSKFAVHEIFNALNSIDNRADRLASLRTIPNSIQQILYYWLNPKVTFNLPEGKPPFTSHNDINTHNAFWSEIRRLKIFVNGGGYDQLPSNKRETLFVSMLEYIHPKDAELLLNMKEKVWPYETFTAEDVREVYPAIFD